MVKYPLALDQEDNIISIKSVTHENRYQTFNCISCKRPLIPRIGKLKEHHFAHKHEVVCSGETYLHNLAKLTFYNSYKQHLNDGRPFQIIISKSYSCNHYQSETNLICSRIIKEELVDLTHHFNHIALEKKDDEFIPDVLLYNETGVKLYIEFAVTHFVEKSKIESGNRIIEFQITREEDIDNIIDLPIDLQSRSIRIFNFNMDGGQKDICQGKCDGYFNFFFVFKSGKSKMLHIDLAEYNRLKNRTSTVYTTVINQVDINEWFDLDEMIDTYAHQVIKAFEKGIEIKNCLLCRYHAQNNSWSHGENESIFCKFLKTKHNSNQAAKCEYFRADSTVYNQYR